MDNFTIINLKAPYRANTKGLRIYMGRPKLPSASAEINARRNYKLNFYYKNKEQLLNASSLHHAIQISELLGLTLDSSELAKLQGYIKDNFKMRVTP